MARIFSIDDELAGYRMLIDPVSDHRAVAAEVRRRDNG